MKLSYWKIFVYEAPEIDYHSLGLQFLKAKPKHTLGSGLGTETLEYNPWSNIGINLF